MGKNPFKIFKKIWRKSTGASISARGASGEIYITWNSKKNQLDGSHEEAHWLMVKLVHLSLGKIFTIINFYMPNNYWEKLECWESLLCIRDCGFYQNCIILGDFNTILHLREKRGGYVIRDLSRENMEDHIPTLDLFDVQPSKGNFT
jgi:hypothetical protein